MHKLYQTQYMLEHQDQYVEVMLQMHFGSGRSEFILDTVAQGPHLMLNQHGELTAKIWSERLVHHSDEMHELYHHGLVHHLHSGRQLRLVHRRFLPNLKHQVHELNLLLDDLRKPDQLLLLRKKQIRAIREVLKENHHEEK